MKVRKSFVSNSSTSSFVMVAFDITDLCEKDAKKISWQHFLRAHPQWESIERDAKELTKGGNYTFEEAIEELRWEYDDVNVEILEDGEEGAPQGRRLLGIKLAEGHSDDGGMNAQLPSTDILEAVKTIRNDTRKLAGVKLPKDWMIHCGICSG